MIGLQISEQGQDTIKDWFTKISLLVEKRWDLERRQISSEVMGGLT